MEQNEMPEYLEDLVNTLIDKYVAYMFKRGTSKKEGCGCRSCYNDAVSIANWYLRKEKRVAQLEIDDLEYATIKDYYRHHPEEFHDDDDFRTRGLYSNST